MKLAARTGHQSRHTQYQEESDASSLAPHKVLITLATTNPRAFGRSCMSMHSVRFRTAFGLCYRTSRAPIATIAR